MRISNDIACIGVNDHNIDLFEGQYVVPDGMAYNSYILTDEKIAVLDTVDASFKEEWLSNIEKNLNGRKPDFLIVHHMEPDHSGNIISFTEKYPNAVVVATQKAFVIMKQFFGADFSERRVIVSEGDTLNLGRHTLTFLTAPMVHWPEVMVSYDDIDKVLFSADAFGKFGALDIEQDWACEARRYYIGIVGKYGQQVQLLLKKASKLDIKTICPLHGPILSENLEYYIDLYNTWSSYKTESEGVMIAYTSVYGNTKKAALTLAKLLEEKGCEKVAVNDLARCDMAEAVEDAFRYGKIVLATTTYNVEIFPFMREFIENLTERNFQNKLIGIIENGTWAPTAAKTMRKMLEGSKNIKFTDTTVTIKSAMTEENKAQLEKMADELCK